MKRTFDLLQNECGASLVELALVLPLLLLLVLGAVDLGRAYYLSMEVAGAAHAAATYGSQNPTDTAGMKAVAQDDAPSITLSYPTLSYGCECSDGTGYSVNCASAPSCASTTEVYRVDITVTGTYTTWFPWHWFGGLIPASITISNSASMRSAAS